jgi:hypothetical protein
MDEEAGKRPKTKMTLKTAYHSQAYWKEFKKMSNCETTLLPVER